MKKKKKLTKGINNLNIKIIIGIGILITLFLIISLIYLTKPEYSAFDFAEILKENSEAQGLLRNIDSDKYLLDIVKLDKKTIEIEQLGPYKELHQGLPESDELYKVKVLDAEKKRGLIAVIDMKDKKVLKVYGLLNLELNIDSTE
jgi:hypothetical protein